MRQSHTLSKGMSGKKSDFLKIFSIIRKFSRPDSKNVGRMSQPIMYCPS